MRYCAAKEGILCRPQNRRTATRQHKWNVMAFFLCIMILPADLGLQDLPSNPDDLAAVDNINSAFNLKMQPYAQGKIER